MGKKSFLKSVEPNRSRTRDIPWPFPVEGEPPKITMRVLGAHELEAAYFETIDHFKRLKDDRGAGRKVDVGDIAFMKRERAALVWRAYSAAGEPLGEDTDEVAAQPSEVTDHLYREWSAFQADVAATPATNEEMKILVTELKKNTPGVPLDALPLSWLTALVTTLASQLASSTQASEGG